MPELRREDQGRVVTVVADVAQNNESTVPGWSTPASTANGSRSSAAPIRINNATPPTTIWAGLWMPAMMRSTTPRSSGMTADTTAGHRPAPVSRRWEAGPSRQ